MDENDDAVKVGQMWQQNKIYLWCDNKIKTRVVFCGTLFGAYFSPIEANAVCLGQNNTNILFSTI